MIEENKDIKKEKVNIKSTLKIMLFIITIGILLLLGKTIYDIINEKNQIPEIITIDYYDNGEPGSRIVVDLNRPEKNLKVKTEDYCSAVNCETKYNDYSLNLTEEEILLLEKYYKNENYREENMALICKLLAENDKEISKKGTNEYQEKEDLNNDGIVTYRESGKKLLKSLINE